MPQLEINSALWILDYHARTRSCTALAIMAAITAEGPGAEVSLATLARKLGVTPPGVRRATMELVRAGYLTPGEPRPVLIGDRPGRHTVHFSLKA